MKRFWVVVAFLGFLFVINDALAQGKMERGKNTGVDGEPWKKCGQAGAECQLPMGRDGKSGDIRAGKVGMESEYQFNSCTVDQFVK